MKKREGDFSYKQFQLLLIYQNETMASLADKISISKAGLGKIYHGDSHPTSEHMEEIARGLNVPVDLLKEDEEIKKKIDSALSEKVKIEELINSIPPQSLIANASIIRDILDGCIREKPDESEIDSGEVAMEVYRQSLTGKEAAAEEEKEAEKEAAALKQEFICEIRDCKQEFLKEKYELIRWLLTHEEENWKSLCQFAMERLNPLGRMLMREQMERIEEMRLISNDYENLEVEADVKYLDSEEEDGEIQLFVQFPRWFSSMFDIEEIYECSYYPEDPEDWEECDAFEAVTDSLRDEMAARCAQECGGWDSETFELFDELLNNAVWSDFTEMELVEDSENPFSPQNIAETKRCMDQLILAMAYDNKGAEISRIFTNWGFAEEMFEKYNIGLPTGR